MQGCQVHVYNGGKCEWASSSIHASFSPYVSMVPAYTQTQLVRESGSLYI